MLTRLTHLRPDLGQIKVFEPNLLWREAQFFDELLLLALCQQKVCDESVESLVVLTVRLEGIFVEINSAVFVFERLMCLSEQQESLAPQE